MSRTGISTRLAIFLYGVCSGAGCSGSATHNPPPRGTVGSAIWFSSSQRIEIRERWDYDRWGPNAGPPINGSRCVAFTRDSLSAAQLAELSAIVLIPLEEGCTTDGYHYAEIAVFDMDGSMARYRDTGCSYLRIEGAQVQLPSLWLYKVELPVAAEPCIEE